MPTDQPDGPISGLFYAFGRRLRAVERHASAEGHEVPARAVLEGYDRALHPWMNGRRLPDLSARVGDLLEPVGFAIGVILSVIIYGPGRLAEILRGGK